MGRRFRRDMQKAVK